MPKPTHLSWEEAAVNALCNSTAYRMLVSSNGARDDPGRRRARLGRDGRARQLRGPVRAQRRRRRPVGVVSSAARAALLRELGCEHVIDRARAGYRFWADEHTQDESEWRRLGKDIRALAGTDPDIVFEHPGRQTMGASVFVCRRGGTVVTCAATTGYMVEYDNRHLWMKLKTIKGSHFSNYREAWAREPARLRGQDRPAALGGVPARQVGEAALQVHRNLARGQARRALPRSQRGARHRRPRRCARRVGEARLTMFRRHAMRRGLLTEIDHVAIAVRDLDAAVAWYARRPRGHRRAPRGRRVRRGRRGARRRSPTPTSSCSRRRPTTRRSPGSSTDAARGSHHVAYRVDDCAAALEAVKVLRRPRDRPGRRGPARGGPRSPSCTRRPRSAP